MIRLLLILLAAIFFFTFILYNNDQTVVLNYMLGIATQPLPVYLIILGSILIGMGLAGMFAIPSWLRHKMEIRRQRKTIQHMEQEIDRLAERTLDTSRAANPAPVAGETEES